MIAVHWFDIPVTTSLIVMAVILAICIVASAISTAKNKKTVEN
jgi:outer membrane murein-binding lipoprotein Lpp